MDRRNPVNLDELFVPLGIKSKECDNLLAVAEEDSGAEDDVAVVDTVAVKATHLVNDINSRFSNDCTQTVGPYLDMADPSRKVSVRDLFKPLDCKSKEVQNLAEERSSDDDEDDHHHHNAEGGGGNQTTGVEHDQSHTQTCGPVLIDSGGYCNPPPKQNLERIFDQNPEEVLTVRHYTNRLVGNYIYIYVIYIHCCLGDISPLPLSSTENYFLLLVGCLTSTTAWRS